MNRSLLGMVVVLTSLWAGPLRAQAAAPILAATEPPVDEVARGVFFGLNIGPAFMTAAPAPSGANRPFSSGATLRLDVGYDIGRCRLAEPLLRREHLLGQRGLRRELRRDGLG